jgi:hypothetical protein
VLRLDCMFDRRYRCIFSLNADYASFSDLNSHDVALSETERVPIRG